MPTQEAADEYLAMIDAPETRASAFAPPGSVCSTSPLLVALRRFEARHRHVRHDDQTRSTKDLLDQFTALAALGPIGLGRSFASTLPRT